MSGKTKKGKSWLLLLRRYLCFFLLMAFAITCCMVLFLNIITTTTGIVFTRDNLEHAAVATFLNVLLLSLIFTVIDGLRRRFLVERPVRRIVNAAEQLQKGDFSVRIKPIRGGDATNGFNIIADYFNQMAEELSGIETLR